MQRKEAVSLQGLPQTIESKGRLALDVLARKHNAEEASKTNRDRLRHRVAIGRASALQCPEGILLLAETTFELNMCTEQ